MADLNDLVVPELGESITEAVIGRWRKRVGEAVSADEPVVDLETDKITVELPAPVAGALTEQRYSEGETVKVGDVVGQIDSSKEGAQEAEEQAAPAKAEAGNGERKERREAKPAPKQEAKPKPEPAREPKPEPQPEAEVDGEQLRKLTPSQRRIARMTGALPAEAREAPAAEAEPREESVKMSPLRKRIAERLVQAQHETASLTTFNEVDMQAIMDLRSEHKQAFLDAHEVKLGFMSFFVKASVAACKLYPGINAEIRGDAIVYKKHYDFGIAVSTERGLVVPVLRNCDQLSFAGIEKGILDLAGKARNGKLSLDDLVGGTFSITNGGIYGSMLSTPLLNYPQTGILGMHNIVPRPMAVDGSVAIRPVMYVALTYDHRVVDGREAVSFLVALRERLEDPERLMFDL